MKNSNCMFYQGVIFGSYFCKKHGKITLDYCGLCPDKKAKSKYNNVKSEVGGIKFDSKKELNRFLELQMLEKSGIIKNLERQKRFELIPTQKDENGKVLFRPVVYIADFTYTDCKTGEFICEDVKGMIVNEFRLKQKMMYYFHHIKVRVVK